MSNPAERVAEDEYERQNDDSPVTGDFEDNSYVRETAPALQNQVPVQTDNESFEDPVQPPYSNSDQQLGKSRLLFLTNITISPLTKYSGGREGGDQ
jgi:hypothetical protein